MADGTLPWWANCVLGQHEKYGTIITSFNHDNTLLFWAVKPDGRTFPLHPESDPRHARAIASLLPEKRHD